MRVQSGGSFHEPCAAWLDACHQHSSAVQRGGVAKPRLSFGSLGGGPAHKSKLEKAKEAAAASAAGDAAAPTSRPPKPSATSR